MSKLNEVKSITLVLDRLRTELNNCSCVEHTAQKFVETVYNEFKESIVLLRVFISIPYAKLPPFNQKFVINLANKIGVNLELKDNTPVLSLIGTHGENSEWNDRRNSKGHIGIPLVSDNFIESVPMLSRLFKDLGLNLNWLKDLGGGMEIKTDTDISGIFFVSDAKESIDSKNRKIIPMQDFVKEYNVGTVFGIGGKYMLVEKNIVAAIFFTRDKLSKENVELFEPMINCFKTASVGLVRQQKIFF
ncbi:MAG: hypothetical protein HY934_07225 [Candidatus Firestonebacteria bacterium]|nr:hypothetical protein [Candidatus Firestonebacteria bacterium]